MKPELTHIKLLQKSKILSLTFSDDRHFDLPCAYLRTHSPSAENTGKGNNQNVNILAVTPIGNYAVKLIFDDGHQTGLYSFDYLYALGMQYQSEIAS